MILSDIMIKQAVKKGDIFISPFDEKKLNPNSYDVTLGKNLIMYLDDVLDMKKSPNYTEIEIDEETGFCLKPGILYLGVTNEYTSNPSYAPSLEGKSSCARMGISVHLTAGFGDVGFYGNWTLEITVIKPVVVYPGMRIAQLYFQKITSTTEVSYDVVGRYNNFEYKDPKPIPYKYHEDRF